MAFPTDAVKKLVEIIKLGISSGNLIATIAAHWVEVADAVIDILKWALDQARPDVVGESVLGHEEAALAGQLNALYQEEAGAMQAEGAIPWLSIIIWIIRLLTQAKKN